MKKVILLSVSILLISLAYSFAEVPCKINYQGRLIKDNVPVDGTKTMVFSIYAVATGGSPIWTSGNVSVEVHNGLFRYVIGTDGGDLSSIDWTAGQALYLQVIVDGETLTPREELSAYPYAINSHLLEGKTKEYFINTSGDSQTKQGNLNIMGNVGIGTADPQGYKLYVAGDILSSTGKFYNVDKNDYIEIRASDESIRFFTQEAEKLTILNSGNVGIGTTGPTHKLDVRGPFRIDQGSSYDVWIQGGSATSGTSRNLAILGIKSSDELRLNLGGEYTGGVRIQGSKTIIDGNVGIGTTSPGAKLDVQGGAIKATGGLIIETRTSDPASPATGQTWLRTDF